MISFIKLLVMCGRIVLAVIGVAIIISSVFYVDYYHQESFVHVIVALIAFVIGTTITIIAFKGLE